MGVKAPANAKRALNRSDFAGLEPLVRVALAVIAQAVQDASDVGNPNRSREAAGWLATTGAQWVEMLVGETDWVAGWLAKLSVLVAACAVA